jgi:hypothetical protein
MRNMNRIAALGTMAAVVLGGTACKSPQVDIHPPFIHEGQTASSKAAHAHALQIGRRVARQMTAGELQPGTMPLNLDWLMDRTALSDNGPADIEISNERMDGGAKYKYKVELDILDRKKYMADAKHGSLKDGNMFDVTVEETVVDRATNAVSYTTLDFMELPFPHDGEKWYTSVSTNTNSPVDPVSTADSILDKIFLPQVRSA